MNLRRQLRRFPQRLKKQTPTKVHCPTQAFSQLSWTKPLLGQICPFILAWHRYFIFFCLLSLSFLLFSFLLFIESLNRVSFLVEERTREREADLARGWEVSVEDEMRGLATLRQTPHQLRRSSSRKSCNSCVPRPLLCRNARVRARATNFQWTSRLQQRTSSV